MNKQLPICCVDNEKLSCLQRPMATVLNWYKKDYRYLFASCWNFSYDYMENYKGVNFVPELSALLNNSRKYTGISFSINEINIEHRIEFITNELLEDRPVVTYMDSFWCPWFPSYMKSHVHHYILIIGVNYKQNHFICLDKLEKQEIVFLPFDDYFHGSGELLTVLQQEYYATTTVLKDTYESLLPNTTKINIINFSSQIRDSLNVELCLNDYHDARVAPLYTWLKGISNDRVNFSSFLELLSIDSYEFFKNKLQTLANEWKTVIILLIRLGCRKQNITGYQNVCDRINIIAEDEYYLMQKLKDTIKNDIKE